MYPASIPTHVVDLTRKDEHRWAEVIACEQVTAHRLAQEAQAEFARVPELLRWAFACLYRASGGLYQGELRAWADALGMSVGTVTMLNCAYELSHVRWSKLFGCTAGLRWVEGLGMVHVRTLDWPLASMGEATRVFRFRREAREFVTVGVLGQVGVLSGMLPRSYSVTINWAPPASRPSFEFGPAFLLRDTLESCDSYAQAVARLTRTRLSTSVFFTVCGTEQGQGCVIERTQDDSAVRKMNGLELVQANHHTADRFRRHNQELHELEVGEDEPFFEDSDRRGGALSRSLAKIPPACSLDALANTLNEAPVLNRHTCQQMVFCPRAGVVSVWRRPGDETSSEGKTGQKAR